LVPLLLGLLACAPRVTPPLSVPLLLGLLACAPRVAPPPSVDLPVTPPVATNARALPTAELVGPADVAAVDATAATPCAALDPAALLAAGRYEWRVMVVGPEGEHGLGDDDTSRKAQYARLEQWAAADAKLVARCGGSGRTSVLVVVDAGTGWETAKLLHPTLDTLDLWLLVADPTPSALPPVRSTPPGRTPGPYMTLVSSGRSWALLASDPSIPASEHPTALEAAARLATLPAETIDPQRTVLVGNPELTWAEAAVGLDALAGIGLVPTMTLTVIDDPLPLRRPAPPPPGTTSLTLGETVPVLAFAFPGYSTSPLYQMIGSGTVADTPDIPDPDAALQRAEDAPPAAPSLQRTLGGATDAPPISDTPAAPAAPGEPGDLPPFPYRREP
jgi:hypothetical protein